MIKQTANIVTGSRILGSILLLLFPAFSVSFYVLYLFCGITDMIDGTIARKTNAVSENGARLDTVADAVFVAVCLVKILPLIQIPSWLWVWIVIIATVKIGNIAWGLIRNKKLISIHSFLNKVTGFLLFLLPLTLAEVKYSSIVVCSIATLAAVQEGIYIVKKVKKVKMKGNNMKFGHLILDFFIIVASSILSAIGLYTFVNPANFAPSGIDGIAMMSQHLFGINMGYVSLAINVPLLLVAWFYINRKYVTYTFIFTIFSSLAMIVMEKINMYEYVSLNNTWISVFASGIMLGTRTALMIKIGGSSGGVDIIASVLQKQKPYLNIEFLISVFCYIIIGVSFFVYKNIESIIMSVVQMLIFNLAMNYILKTTRNAVEVKIVTDEPEKFKEDILSNLKHGATVIKCNGMYTGDEKSMIVTLINIHQMNELIKLSKKYNNTFLYFSDATGVWGNFRWNKSDAVK